MDGMLTKADIKLIRSLGDGRARMENGLFVTEGFKMVEELLDSGMRTERLFVTRDTDMSSFAGRADAEVISHSEMERISHLKTPPGVLALARIPLRQFDAAIAERELVLALDGVRDPGNLGTIIRVADWFGIGTVVCSQGSADCYNPKAVQATMGALFRVAVHYADLAGFVSGAVMNGIRVFGTMLEGENIYEARLSPSGIIVMGSESHGISPEIAPLIPEKLFIPPYPAGRHGPESLNVAVAAAITCAEFRRRM